MTTPEDFGIVFREPVDWDAKWFDAAMVAVAEQAKKRKDWPVEITMNDVRAILKARPRPYHDDRWHAARLRIEAMPGWTIEPVYHHHRLGYSTVSYKVSYKKNV